MGLPPKIGKIGEYMTLSSGPMRLAAVYQSHTLPWRNVWLYNWRKNTQDESGAVRVPEHKKVRQQLQQWTMVRLCKNDGRAKWKRAQCPKLEQCEPQNKTVLDYNLKSKINSYDFILIKQMIEYINTWGRRAKSPMQKNSK